MEFGEQHHGPELDINLPREAFFDALERTVLHTSDELAYPQYLECLEQEVREAVPEDDILDRRSVLYECVGDIERRRGDFDLALASYGRARDATEATTVQAASPARNQGNLLLHELGRPADSVEAYEKAKAIIDHNWKSDGVIIDEFKFNNYSDLLAHLAGAYQAANELGKLRELNKLIMARGGLTPAIFGYGTCHQGWHDGSELPYETLMYTEISETLQSNFNDIEPAAKPEIQARLLSLEELVTNDAFLAHAPEQRDNVIALLQIKYAELEPGSVETGERLKRAIRLVRQHDLVVPETSLKIMLAQNQIMLDKPLREVTRTLLRAADSSTRSLTLGVTVEQSQIQVVTSMLLPILKSRGDWLAIRGLQRSLKKVGLAIDFIKT
jgi:tetratricopeptide (TPR) repeat protein